MGWDKGCQLSETRRAKANTLVGPIGIQGMQSIDQW